MHNRSRVHCVLCCAGESLVSGMIAGSAVAFKANKAKLDSPEVLCYASKSEGMFVRESLIFRCVCVCVRVCVCVCDRACVCACVCVCA